MDNFGVVEVASQRRAVAPGWAYVPDNSSRNVPPALATAMAMAASTASSAGAASTAGRAGGAAKNSRKRSTRNQGGAAAAGSSVALFSHLTSRQETKLRKELELLDRDGGAVASGGRDNAIPIPAKAIKAQNKYTPNVRKILASQKSFANHLDDFNALTALHENNPYMHHNHGHGGNDATTSGRESRNAAAAASAAATATTTASNSKSSSRRPAKKDTKKDTRKDTKRGGSRRSASAATPSGADTPMTDAPADEAEATEGKTDTGQQPDSAAVTAPAAPVSSILLPYTGPQPPPHPLDNDPLLISGMPPLPTDDELRGLVSGPPLSYVEARATYGEDDSRYPTRVFCEICGYWGRVKCTKCGTPVCALECLELHREECITRYGL
ncbi:hypothetical protein SEUCBS139899_009949 [Sporothrix eucalyptigena]|uniref:HIT-type domain-containing protein n=1 Tax=Sporothrix eucalyptigena TaxID=1812306 RepID=A0ABP0D0R2_9PEZI